MGIHSNPLRIGNFTSSVCSALIKTGKRDMTEAELEEHKMANPGSRKKTIESGFSSAGITLIEETNMERQMDLPLTVNIAARPLSWGKACEIQIFRTLDTSYERCSQETIQHPSIKYWSGSPDGKKHIDGMVIAAEFKCPITRKSYMQFYNCDTINDVREKHPDGEDYYWQLLSNSELLRALHPELPQATHAELSIFMPFQSELEDIREICRSSDNLPIEEVFQYQWIVNSNDDELPYLKDGGKVDHLKKFFFEIPKDDILLLKNRIIEAGTMLIPR